MSESVATARIAEALTKDAQYRYLRDHRPDLLERCANIGHAITCMSPNTPRLELAAAAECMAVYLATSLLRSEDR